MGLFGSKKEGLVKVPIKHTGGGQDHTQGHWVRTADSADVPAAGISAPAGVTFDDGAAAAGPTTDELWDLVQADIAAEKAREQAAQEEHEASWFYVSERLDDLAATLDPASAARKHVDTLNWYLDRAEYGLTGSGEHTPRSDAMYGQSFGGDDAIDPRRLRPFAGAWDELTKERFAELVTAARAHGRPVEDTGYLRGLVKTGVLLDCAREGARYAGNGFDGDVLADAEREWASSYPIQKRAVDSIAKRVIGTSDV